MGDMKTLLANATDDELRVIATVAARAAAKPAVVVTLNEGGRNRRYVVAQEDEDLFDGVDTADAFNAAHGPWASFGGQWLRSLGKVDEMYRSCLDGRSIVKVARLDRAKVWSR